MRYKKSIISWENLIPSHWKEIKGKYLFTNEKEIIGEKWLHEQRISLTYDGVIPRDNEDSSGLNPESLATYQVVKENDLLFKLIDLENEKTSRVGLSSYNGITSSAYIRVNVNDMYPKYYFYWYYSLWFRFIYNRLGNGVRSTLNAKDLLDLFVPVPPKEEQIKLSEIIEKKTYKIDQLIKNQQQQIEKLKEYKQSLISEVVTKGLDKNVEFKDSGVDWIGQIPLKWNLITFKILFQLNKGISITKEDLDDED
jgi:type I restriction enzyme S subunit